MTSFVYAVFSIASLQCSVRPEISPCTCQSVDSPNYVNLECEKLESFHTIVDVLANKFQPHVEIDLKITHSQLEDLEMRSFTDMNLNVVKLRMQWNGLRSLPELPFRGLSNVKYLSVGDNELEEIPKHVLNHMPILQTVDIARCHIRSVQQDDLKGIQMVTNLILPSNNITRLDRGAFPPSLKTLHLGRNQIEALNGSLHDLVKLESLFINANSISDLEGEFPDTNTLKLLMAHNNRLERLPSNMRGMDQLEIMHLHFNRLRSFDGVLKGAEFLNELMAHNNELEYLAHDEFQACRRLEHLNLAVNHIRSTNGSLLPMAKLAIANFSFNEIEEFSMEELRGLRSLKILDLSNNRIKRLRPSLEHMHDLPLVDLRLDHNRIITLDAALAGLSHLRILGLSYNRMEFILPGDFDGMDRLEILDMTGNELVELKELETSNLPSLKILKVAYNNITKLDRDFYGLPVLCQVNLTNNQISTISSELVSRTRCKNHNVPGKLEIHLDDNPIMCDVRLNELCRLMMAQDARIRGRSQCFENDQEVCTVLPMLYKIELPLLIAKLKTGEAEDAKPVMQVLVPSPLLLNNNADELLPPIIATLSQPLIIAPPVATTTPSADVLVNKVDADVEDNATTTTASTTMKSTTTITPVTSTIPAATKAPIIAAEILTTTPPTTTTTITPTPTTISELNETLPVVLDIEEPNPNVTPSEDSRRPIADRPNATASINEPSRIEEQTLLEPPPPVVTTAEEQHDRVADTVAKTEYETIEYIPNLVQPAIAAPTPPSKTNLLEEDSQSNSVHEAMLSDLEHAAQSLQIPEEPPEE
ncbi:podocan [Scaptodrosophila lebanonensis]|uniref:Podocan n=1 Tax=Drosophila lebanonensis TaxID=7225 RepID=A0A6J2TX17_DROLE|nr:podocan [Scaptodrosophila lebanonensis]